MTDTDQATGPRRMAVFDCDGTLVDGQGAVIKAMEQAFANCALPTPDRSAVRRLVGLSLPQAVQHLVPDAGNDLLRDVVSGYKSAFRAAREAGELSEPLYPGMADLLTALTAAGWLLAVATGKSDRGLTHCLTAHGILRQFTSLQTADRHPSKPHPAMLLAALEDGPAMPLDAVMIGDTAYDMMMAREAGVPAIGVAWGYHETAELIAAGAEFVATDAAELRDYLLA